MNNSTENKGQLLIVDDVAQNIEVLAQVLGNDYNINFAMNGTKALEMASRTPRPELILLDVMMPGIDGYEVCKRLKANPQLASIPVIFVTAKSDIFDEVKGFEVGAVDYLSKPITPVIAKARVKTHLQLTRAQHELQKQNEILQENIKLQEEVERITRHDLKGPLTAFLNIPEMLAMDSNLTEDQHEMLQMLGASGKRMLDMINQSQDMVKIERGEYQLHPISVNICPIVVQIKKEMNILLSRKKIDLDISIHGESLSKNSDFIVMGEESLFYPMLSNIIKNAIEASPINETVYINLMKNNEIILSVANKGAIPEQLRNKFFTRYATYGKKRGTGLGAYSALLMAKTLGGDIKVTTSESDGTKLEVCFPLHNNNNEVDSTQKTRNRMNVLIAESNSHMRSMQKALLQNMGFNNIEEIDNGDMAFSLIESRAFDLILFEWDIPGTNGEELLNKIHLTKKADNLNTLIAIRSNDINIIDIKCDFPNTICIGKPFAGDLFQAKINELIPES